MYTQVNSNREITPSKSNCGRGAQRLSLILHYSFSVLWKEETHWAGTREKLVQRFCFKNEETEKDEREWTGKRWVFAGRRASVYN